MRLLRAYRVHLLLFAAGLLVYGATAGTRLGGQSTDPHFVFQADAWLNGQLAIDPPPSKGDDWAKLETVELADGRVVSGRRLSTRPRFRIAGGGEIPSREIRRVVKTTHYVSFPPFPAVLMLPQAAFHGRHANDVWVTVIVAALILPLFWSVLGRLREAGLSRRTDREHLWLVAGLAFGTVLYFSAVQGRVWYTAHVVGVALALGYARASIEARYPILAGLCLGLAAVTRTPMAFMFPLFLLEAWRMAQRSGAAGVDLRRFFLTCARFAAPVVVIAIAAFVYNQARFAEPTEFGHSYLAVRQQAQIETTGMFSLDYLSRNLAVAFTLLPDLSWKEPYVRVGGHGLAIWFTTPVLFLLLWPREKHPLHRTLWLTVAFVAVPTLFYQNSGWYQFGYRFALDYMVLLFMLLAIGGRPFGRVAKALIVAGIVINLFGAITFARMPEHYGGSYDVVIRH